MPGITGAITATTNKPWASPSTIPNHQLKTCAL